MFEKGEAEKCLGGQTQLPLHEPDALSLIPESHDGKKEPLLLLNMSVRLHVQHRLAMLGPFFHPPKASNMIASHYRTYFMLIDNIIRECN